MLAKLGQLINKKSTSVQVNKQSCENPCQQSQQISQSFYSLDNHSSKFDKSINDTSPAKNIEQSQNLETILTNYYQVSNIIPPTQQKNNGWKIGDSLDVIYEQSKAFNETTQQVIKEDVQQHLNVSQIKSHIPKNNPFIQVQDQSASILKQIQMLNSQVIQKNETQRRCTIQEMKQMYRKIGILQTQQKQLQNSLNLAMKMLQTSKNQNNILQKELQSCRNEQTKKIMYPKDWKLLKIQNGVLQKIQNRKFPQYPNTHQNNTNTLKLLYKECSMNSVVKIFENKAYTIFIEFDDTSLKMLTVKIRLTPKIQNIGTNRYKFMIKFIGSLKDDKSNSSSQSLQQIQSNQYEDQINFREQDQLCLEHIYTAKVAEFDTKTNKSNSWELLVPIPITWFIRKRFQNINNKDTLKKITKNLSTYQIQMKTHLKSIKQISRLWWSQQGSFFSVIGNKQILKFQIASKQALDLQNQGKDKQVDIVFRIMGKRNGQKVRAFIQFTSFYFSI